VTRLLRRKTTIAIAGLAMLAGGGAAGAVAATSAGGTTAGTSTQAFIRDLAARLDVSPATLTAAVRAALDDRISAAVDAGRISAAQGAALERRAAVRAAFPMLGRRALLRSRLLVAGARIAAAYLGISAPVLRGDLASGQTLAQIASSTPGRSTAGLQQALLGWATARLERAVEAGKITGAQQERLLTALTNRLPTLLERNWNTTRGGRLALRRHRRIR
jgi:hypothetical protein